MSPSTKYTPDSNDTVEGEQLRYTRGYEIMAQQLVFPYRKSDRCPNQNGQEAKPHFLASNRFLN